MWSTKLGKFPRFGCTAITNWHDREYCKHATNSNKLINLEFLVLSQPTKYRRTIHEHTVHQQQGRIAVLQRWALNTSSSSAGYLLFINYLNQIMIFRCMREHILYVTIFVGFCGTQNRVHWTLHCLFFSVIYRRTCVFGSCQSVCRVGVGGEFRNNICCAHCMQRIFKTCACHLNGASACLPPNTKMLV